MLNFFVGDLLNGKSLHEKGPNLPTDCKYVVSVVRLLASQSVFRRRFFQHVFCCPYVGPFLWENSDSLSKLCPHVVLTHLDIVSLSLSIHVF